MNVCIIGSYAKALVMTTDRIPLVGETLIGQNYRETYGGKGSDMAVQAARLGADVSYLGVVGQDNFGTEFIELMKQENVNIEKLRVTADEATGIGFIIKDTRANNVITIAPGANLAFSTADIDAGIGLIGKADVVLGQLEIPLNTVLYAMKKARELGKITILNPAPAIDLTGYDLSDIDILTPNETEAKIAAGLPVESTLSERVVAELLLKTGCKSIVMTLGDKGAAVVTAKEHYLVESHRIEVVDSNGAGDCFNASLAAALAEGKDLKESVYFANAAAALCCTKWETVPSYHYQADVEAFIRERGNDNES